MYFDWDIQKAAINLAKHRIAFEDAARTFFDSHALLEKERVDEGEQRWELLGQAEGGLLMVVIHVIRERDGNELIRLISARKAERHERRKYEAGRTNSEV